MIRLRLAAVLGFVLLVAAGVVLCGILGDQFVSLPYQDPTPDMLHQQAAAMAAARHDAITRLWIGGSLATIGLTVLGYTAKAWLKQGRSTGLSLADILRNP